MYPSKRAFQSARDVMSPKIIFIDGMATAREAVELMRLEKVEALIVKKRRPGDAFGIVVIKDLIRGVIIPDMGSEEVNVYEIMTKPAISVPAAMDVRYVASLMMRANLRIAPVEDQGEYIGMISLSTLIIDNVLF